MEDAAQTLKDLEHRFWQSMVDNDTDAALALLENPALIVSTHGSMMFDHAGYRRMAEHGSMLVTAFGHGRHACPAQPFSLTAMSTATTRLLGRYDLTPEWDRYPRPVSAQIGGVARSADVCRVGYRMR